MAVLLSTLVCLNIALDTQFLNISIPHLLKILYTTFLFINRWRVGSEQVHLKLESKIVMLPLIKIPTDKRNHYILEIFTCQNLTGNKEHQC